MRVFLTGAAGFIGYHTCLSLLNSGHDVYGFDSVNNYYDPFYKELRLSKLRTFPRFSFSKAQLEEKDVLRLAFDSFAPTHVVHLAAQAGVRYSLSHPDA